MRTKITVEVPMQQSIKRLPKTISAADPPISGQSSLLSLVTHIPPTMTIVKPAPKRAMETKNTQQIARQEPRISSDVEGIVGCFRKLENEKKYIKLLKFTGIYSTCQIMH